MYHISKNLSRIRHSMNLTQIEFAELFDIRDRKGMPSNDKVWTYENGKANPTMTLIERVANATGVPYEILVTEDISEDIINKTIFREYIEGKRNYDEAKEKKDAKSFADIRRDQKNSDNPYLVPFVDIPAQAGYTKAYQQIDYIATLKKYPILPDVDPAGAVWRYFQIEGHSMENPNPKDGEDEGLREGDTILCSQVPKEDWDQFSNLYTYVIVTDENLWIKDVDRIELAKEAKWILISRNQEYPPFTVDIKDVRQLWLMRRHVRNRAKKHRMYNMKEILQQLKNNNKS